MRILFGAAFLGGLFVAGCSGPESRPWDNTAYRSIREHFEAVDTPQAGDAVEDELPEAPPTGLETLTRLSVDDAVRIGIANTPSLRRAGYRVDIAAGRVIQAGLYPNPSLTFDGESIGADAGAGGETIYRLEQEIVLGGKIDRAREVARADQLAAQAEFVAEEFAVASRVTRAYFAAVSARERLRSRQQLIDLSEQLLDAATAQVEAGAATRPDRLRAEVVREQARIELESARLEADATLSQLYSAMGLDEPMDLVLATAPDVLPSFPSREEIAAAALEANSRVSLARIAIERAKRAHDLARARAVPNLIASVGPRYSDLDNETTMDFGIGIEIPIFDRNQGNIRSALAERLSSAAQLRDVQLQLISEVADAWAAYESARIATNRYREQLLPKAEQTLDLTRQAYERGKADYLRLLDAQQVVAESRIAYVDALERLHEAAALLRELAQTDTPWRESSAEEAAQVEEAR